MKIQCKLSDNENTEQCAAVGRQQHSNDTPGHFNSCDLTVTSFSLLSLLKRICDANNHGNEF